MHNSKSVLICLVFKLLIAFASEGDGDSLFSINTSKVPSKIIFETYWNVPTFQCRSHKIYFTNLTRKYNIFQNENDNFRGEKIAILYDPGAFPAILTSSNGSKIVYRNGGVPQEGNLSMHLELFRKTVNELIPEENFAGVGVIDFESWRPIFRQNFGTLKPYIDYSIALEKQKHPSWSLSSLEKHAERLFEMNGRIFMEETLLYAKSLRPKAAWGYYAYPYCFNMSPSNMNTKCPFQVVKENDRTEWLFAASDDLYPSLYMRQLNITAKQRTQMIVGRIDESHRIIRQLNKPTKTPIIPYFWYKYQDTKEFLSKEDMYNSLHTLKSSLVDGLIIWGSSNDVNTKQNCEDLYNYIDKILGPALNNL